MKKTFTLTHPKIKLARLFEGAKSDVKKYLNRERNKTLPEGADYWDFDCKFGPDEEQAEVIHVGDINRCISNIEAQQQSQFYLEIIARAGSRSAQVKQIDTDDEQPEDEEG